jgi:hypothetical protein
MIHTGSARAHPEPDGQASHQVGRAAQRPARDQHRGTMTDPFLVECGNSERMLVLPSCWIVRIDRIPTGASRRSGRHPSTAPLAASTCCGEAPIREQFACAPPISVMLPTSSVHNPLNRRCDRAQSSFRTRPLPGAAMSRFLLVGRATMLDALWLDRFRCFGLIVHLRDLSHEAGDLRLNQYRGEPFGGPGLFQAQRLTSTGVLHAPA